MGNYKSIIYSSLAIECFNIVFLSSGNNVKILSIVGFSGRHPEVHPIVRLLHIQWALDMMHDCGFAQTVNFPTRNDNILDLFFTNRPTLVQECYSAPGISDHEIVMVTLEPQAFYNLINSYKIYLWNKVKFSELKENMCNFAAEFCDHFSDETRVEILWMHLRDKLLFLLDKFVPSKLKNNNNCQPWINRNIRQSRQLKQASYNCARFTNCLMTGPTIKTLKRICKRNAKGLSESTCLIPYITHTKMARRKDSLDM